MISLLIKNVDHAIKKEATIAQKRCSPHLKRQGIDKRFVRLLPDADGHNPQCQRAVIIDKSTYSGSERWQLGPLTPGSTLAAGASQQMS